MSDAGGDAPRAFVLGAGRAGSGLARALRATGLVVTGVHGRRAVPADGVTAGVIPIGLRGATVALVAVRDAQLDAALAEIAPALPAGCALLHLSGATDPAALAPLRARGIACGTFHPLVPLAAGADAAALLRGAWIGIDGDAAAVEAAHVLAAALGAHALAIPPGAKARYHAAAVLASNYPVVLAALAERLMRDTGVAPAAARGAVAALLGRASLNVERASMDADLRDVLTGPIVRGDHEVVRRHLEALGGDPALAEVYRALAEATAALVAAGDAPVEFTRNETTTRGA